MGNAVVKYWPRKSLTLCSTLGNTINFNEVGWQYDENYGGYPIDLTDTQRKTLIRVWFYLATTVDTNFPKLLGHTVHSDSMETLTGNDTQVLYSPMVDVGTTVYTDNISTQISSGHNAEIYNIAGPWDSGYTTPGLCSVISRWWAGDFWWGNFNCALSYYTGAPSLLSTLNNIASGVCSFRAKFEWSWPFGSGNFDMYASDPVQWRDIQSASSGERDYWTRVRMYAIEVSFDGSNWHSFARVISTSYQSGHQAWTMGGNYLIEAPTVYANLYPDVLFV